MLDLKNKKKFLRKDVSVRDQNAGRSIALVFWQGRNVGFYAVALDVKIKTRGLKMKF